MYLWIYRQTETVEYLKRSLNDSSQSPPTSTSKICPHILTNSNIYSFIDDKGIDSRDSRSLPQIDRGAN